MPQSANSYDEVRIPLGKMTFTPDVPATALGTDEYNAGFNVETDVRGIRSISGQQAILKPVPGLYAPIFITGGFRRGGEWWFVAATEGDGISVGGKWYACSANHDWYDITPPGIDTVGYTQVTNITETWNGTVLFINDEHNPPFFWPDEAPTIVTPVQDMIAYSNQVPLNIANIVPVTTTTKKITFATAQPSAPFAVGSQIIVAGVYPADYNSITQSGFTAYTVTACTTTDVTIQNSLSTAYSSGGTVAPLYSWNYNTDWSKVYAKWMRMYQTPNVGTILVAGNLTATPVSDPTTKENFPVTVQWSQSFGLNQAPITWTPTATNVANQLEVPLRGPSVDAFPCNGQFFLCSYWDTVVFSPLNYSTTSAPIIGVKLLNQGRGLLSSNCWANTDRLVYGIDARDIWVFDGNDFKGIGNQRVRNWFFDQIDPQYYDRIHMQTNTQKSQIEIYYPDSTAFGGIPNRMLSYRYDLDVWNPPIFVAEASFATESPVFIGSSATVTNVGGTNVSGTGTGATFDISYSGATYSAVVNSHGTGYAVGNQILVSGVSMGGTTPYNDVLLTVTAGPGAAGTGIDVVVAEGRSPATFTPNLASRTITYIRGTHSGEPDPRYFGNYEGTLVQKDIGFSFINNTYIISNFQRDNLRLSKDYSNKVMVHRMLPEIVNLDGTGVPMYPGTGAVDITLKGANSVGSVPESKNTVTVPVNSTGDTNADSPWAQFDQNAYRVNSIELSYGSDTTTWMCNALTIQLTPVEDDR